MHALPSCPIASHCTQVLAHAGGARVRANGKWQVWLRASTGALGCGQVASVAARKCGRAQVLPISRALGCPGFRPATHWMIRLPLQAGAIDVRFILTEGRHLPIISLYVCIYIELFFSGSDDDTHTFISLIPILFPLVYL